MDTILSSLVFITGAVIFSEFVFRLINKIEKRRLLHEREANALFKNSIDGIFVFQSNGHLIDMNHGAEEMTGWDLKEANEKCIFDSIFQLEPSLLTFEKILNENKTSIMVDDGLLLTKDGAELPISATFSRIYNDYGQTKIAVIVRDLSQQKQMGEVILKLYQETSQKQVEAEKLYRIANKLASIKDLTADNRQQIFANVVNDMQKLLGCSYVGLCLDELSNEATDAIAITDSDQRVNMLQSIKIAKEKKECTEEQMITFTSQQGQKISIYPLLVENATLGYIWISEKKDREWTLRQQELLKSIIIVLSISLENLMMYYKMKDVAMLEERERLAREMHDGLAQIISSIHIKVEFIKHLTKEIDRETYLIMRDAVDELSEIVNQANHEIRQNLFNLRSPFYSKGAFLDLLKKYIEQFQIQNQIEVEYLNHLKSKQIDITEYTKMHVIRILQEALSNVRRHSTASKAYLSVHYEESGHYVFIVEDKGIGFAWAGIETINHYGLMTMKERSKLIKGEVHIHTTPNVGTKVVLNIPSGGETYEEN